MKFNSGIAAAIVPGFAVAGLPACEKGPAQKAGKSIDDAAKKVGEKVEQAGESIDNAAKKVGEKMEEAGDKIKDAAKDAKK